MRSIVTLLTIALCVVAKIATATPVNIAQSELDDILQGFDSATDETKPSNPSNQNSPADELDQLLQGFDDTPAENKTTDSVDDVLQGFSDESSAAVANNGTGAPVIRNWEYHADTTFDLSYNYAHKAPEHGEPDYRGLSALRFQYEPEFKYRFNKHWTSVLSANAFYDFSYGLNGRDQYTTDMLEVYERELELREAYVLGSSPNADVKIGRQIVVWGKSDNIRIVDILNPLDLREPGIVDIEDLRLPVTMTRLDYYFQKWSITGITIHEIRFNKVPVYNSEYYPGTAPAPPEDKPESTPENTEFALALNGYFSGWDLSLHWAQVFDDQAHLEVIAPSAIIQRHSRINMAGAAANVALGNWLLKTELARLTGLKLSNIPGRDFDRFDALLGVEYAGLQDAMLSLEIANRHIFDYASQLMQPPNSMREDNVQYALRYNGSFLHDRLDIIFLSSVFGKHGEDGGFTRLSGEYDVLDDFAVTLGVIDYHSGDNPRFQAISNNDRIFLELRYSY